MPSTRLLTNETSTNMNDMAPGIADYFAGPPPEEFLAARCTEVLKLNPWLAGRLKTVDGELSLVWDDDPSGTPAGDDFYRVVDASALGLEDVTSAFEAVTRISGQHEGALPAALEACVCKAGVFCADKDEPVFRVRLVKGAADFAVMCSMTHAIGDGATIYTIHGMLGETGAPAALDPARGDDLDFYASIQGHADRAIVGTGALGCKVARGFQGLSSHAKAVLDCVARSGYGTPNADASPDRPGPTPGATFRFGYYYVDADKVAAAKAQHVPEAGAPYLSTNDVFTSRLFQTTGSDIGAIAYNARAAAGVPAEKPGCYQILLYLDAAAIASPAGVRKVVGDAAPPPVVPSADGPPPRVGFITNWTQRHRPLELPGASNRLHQPYFVNLPGIAVPMSFYHGMAILFQAHPGKYAAFFFSFAGGDELKENLFAGEVQLLPLAAPARNV